MTGPSGPEPPERDGEPPANGSADTGLDRLLSDPTRLAIMSVLCTAEWCDFAFVRDAVSLSDSALSKQLTTLKKDARVEQQRTYFGRVPKTTVRATDEGRYRFRTHVAALREIVESTQRLGSDGGRTPS